MGGKKRKASGGASQPKGPREFDPKESKLSITTYKDVADSEDEYYDQDEILFDDAPSKKQRRLEEEEAFLEESDEEVFANHEDSDSEEDEVVDLRPKAKKASKKRDIDSESESDGRKEEDEDEEDAGWFGPSKKDFYDADQIETQDDAEEEEQEARRLQKRRLGKMQEEDFIFNENEWLAPEPEEKAESKVITETLKDVEIPDGMPANERRRFLSNRYPELDYLADELLELNPLLTSLEKEAEGQPRTSLAVIKYRTCATYVATISMYFAVLTSVHDSTSSTKPLALDPMELRDHEVMKYLLESREAWGKVKELKASKVSDSASGMLSPPEEGEILVDDSVVSTSKPAKKTSKAIGEKRTKSKKTSGSADDIEHSLADLSALLSMSTKTKKKAQSKQIANDDSDFGEEEILDAKTGADKAARKKSLRFYTSQIVQKANRRAGAAKDVGGDADIPYRERLKDRQARLDAEAEKRGKKDSKHGADLGDSDGEDDQVANGEKDADDEYYDMVAARKKKAKATKSEAIAAANKRERVFEPEELDESRKRKINYQISANKGLAPKRNKLNRNPRVKKRMRYESKQKKLKSMRAVYSGGEGKGGYGGELTGIKSGLVKSVKL